MRFDLSLFALAAAPLTVLAGSHIVHRHAHNDIAKRADSSVHLYKRSFDGRYTFYDVGGAAGACGKFNTPDEHIVALNSAQYGSGYPGPNCWRRLKISYGGKTTTAVVTDECPGCPYGGLDFTRGLFQVFAPLSLGVLHGTWEWDDGGDSDPEPQHTTHKPEPTTTHHEEPKTTSHPPPPPPPPSSTHHTTSTHETTSSTHTSSSSSIKSHSSTSSSQAVSVSSTALPLPTASIIASSNQTQNVVAYNELLVNMAYMIVDGVEV